MVPFLALAFIADSCLFKEAPLCNSTVEDLVRQGKGLHYFELNFTDFSFFGSKGKMQLVIITCLLAPLLMMSATKGGFGSYLEKHRYSGPLVLPTQQVDEQRTPRNRGEAWEFKTTEAPGFLKYLLKTRYSGQLIGNI